MWPFSKSAPEERTQTQDMADAMFPWIQVPFFGESTLVKIRMLTQAQIRSVGDFSLIETFTDRIEQKRKQKHLKMSDFVSYAELHHGLCKEALIFPTYEEIFSACDIDSRTDPIRKELDEIIAILKKTPTSKERGELEDRAMQLKVWVDLILPEDFTTTVSMAAMGVERSGIKKVSEDMLIEAAVLAELGHDNPADHIDGPWMNLPSAQFYKNDIDMRSRHLLQKRKAELRGQRGVKEKHVR